MIDGELITLVMYGFIGALGVEGAFATIRYAITKREERLRLEMDRKWRQEDMRAMEGTVQLLLTDRELATSLRDKITVALREERQRTEAIAAAQAPAQLPEAPPPKRARKRKT